MPKLTRDQILAVADIKTEEVQVPEWGGSVFVRGLTGAQRVKFEMKVVEHRGTKQIWHRENIRARIIVMSVVDDKGELLFSEKDIKAVSEKAAGALERIFNVAQRLSGLSKQDVAELAKN